MQYVQCFRRSFFFLCIRMKVVQRYVVLAPNDLVEVGQSMQRRVDEEIVRESNFQEFCGDAPQIQVLDRR